MCLCKQKFTQAPLFDLAGGATDDFVTKVASWLPTVITVTLRLENQDQQNFNQLSLNCATHLSVNINVYCFLLSYPIMVADL